MSAVVAAVVRDAIVQTTAITALVGSGSSARVYASYRPSTALPCIVLTYGSDQDLSPTLARTDRLRRMNVQIDCIGATLAASRVLAEEVREALHGAKGVNRSTTIIEIRVTSVQTEYDFGQEATDDQVHITTVSAEVTYRSPAVNPTFIVDPNAQP